jgi:hypothetical protein
MRRLWVTLAWLLALATVAAAAWWWWSAPPGAPAGTLAEAVAVVPAADGVLVVASPQRSARWLASHPAAA